MGRSKGYKVNPFREVVLDSLRSMRDFVFRRTWPKFDAADAERAREYFDQHGWVIFRGVFSADEVSEYRRLAMLDESRGHQGDLLSNPALGAGRFVLEPRVVRIVASLLGGAPCYFGDSTLSINADTIGFHKDNPDRDRADGPDWRSPYTLLRVGLYLQDHDVHSGGLSLRDGSHRTPDHAAGTPISMPTLSGDLVVWSLCTTHSANAVRLRLVPRLFVPVPIAWALSHTRWGRLVPLLKPRAAADRLALFATFGRGDPHQERYLRYLASRQYAVSTWQRSQYAATTIEQAQRAGVNVIEMAKAAAGIDVRTLNREHVAL